MEQLQHAGEGRVERKAQRVGLFGWNGWPAGSVGERRREGGGDEGCKERRGGGVATPASKVKTADCKRLNFDEDYRYRASIIPVSLVDFDNTAFPTTCIFGRHVVKRFSHDQP